MRVLSRSFLSAIALVACLWPLHGQQPAAPATPDVPALNRAADAAYLRGDYESARQSLAAAWDLLQQTPPENPARYDVLKRLTSVCAASGQFADAQNYLNLAIDWRRSVSGPDDPRIADDWLVSVALYRGSKEFDKAFKLFPSILTTHVRAYSFDSPQVAEDYSRMALVLMDQKQPKDAAGILDVAIGIRTRLSGPLDISLLPLLDRLGAIDNSQNDYGKAETVFRHALAIRETLFGKEDPELLSTLDGLAYACFGESKYDVAEPIYRRLLALWISSAGEDHPMIALTLDRIATFYAAEKKFDLAKQSSDRANLIRTNFLGNGLAAEAAEQIEEDHEDTAHALYRRLMKVLDPPDPMYQKLRDGTEIILEKLGDPPPAGPQPKKAPAPLKKASTGP